MADNITVFGAGYVGLVTGVCLANDGNKVQVLDVDREKVAALTGGNCPFFEPGLDALTRQGLERGDLTFAVPDQAEPLGDIVIVAVGTPTTASGGADLSFVRAVIEFLIDRAASGTVVVMKSTVPPGTGAGFAKRLAVRNMHYVSNPEFLREGSAVSDWYETDRVVIGGHGSALERVEALYAGLSVPILRCDITEAEMIKYASNAFLATKISFINEIAALCDLVGANIDDVARGIGMDQRIGSAFLRPGIGYGGSCFPKDTRALDFIAAINGYDFHLLRSVIDVNSRQRMLPVRALRAQFGSLEGKRVSVLGLTFKPQTDDTREAPAVEIISLLQAEGARVLGYNPIPVSLPSSVQIAETLEDAFRDADAVVLTTEWSEITLADWPTLIRSMGAAPVIFDGRNALDPEMIRAAGGHYFGVGRPDHRNETNRAT